jgi:FkbM family methyltransferase
VFIDIGANTGIYSMVAASLLTNGTVISYEPFPLMSSYLLKNVVHNKFGNVRLRTFGISNETSGKKFYMNRGIPTSFSFSREVDDAVAVELFTKKLDDAVKMENLERIDYIKIDAEGEEKKILDGARNVIEKFRPIIQLELMYGELNKIDGYKIFSPKVKSDNRLYIPEDSEKIKIARELGLTEIA